MNIINTKEPTPLTLSIEPKCFAEFWDWMHDELEHHCLCDSKHDNFNEALNKFLTRSEDEILRKFLFDNPSHLDYDDPTIIAFDKNGKGLNAKDLKEIND